MAGQYASHPLAIAVAGGISSIVLAYITTTITINTQKETTDDQIASAAKIAQQDRRMEAYKDLLASLVTKRETLLAAVCEDEKPGNAVDQEQRILLTAAARHADDSWNGIWSRTDIYASENLRKAIGDLKSVERVYTGGGQGGVGVGGFSKVSDKGYAECEAIHLGEFDSKLNVIRRVIKEDLGMDES